MSIIKNPLQLIAKMQQARETTGLCDVLRRTRVIHPPRDHHYRMMNAFTDELIRPGRAASPPS